MTENHTEHSPTGHVTLGKYVVGFALAMVLTLASFGIVVAGVQPTYIAIIVLVIAAVLQILVHLHYFLHLDRSKDQTWNMVSIVFTALIVFVFIAGTVWVIMTLNSRLM